MAINAAYATAANYRSVVGKTDTGQDAEILTDLTAISRYLEGKLGRFFNKDASDVARIYLPVRSTATLRVDDLSAAPTTVKIDMDQDGVYETDIDSSDYELLPLNADKGPEPRPFTQIRLVSWGDYSWWLAGQRVEVTGKWGWPAVPGPVQRATIHLAAILRLETPRATRRIVELEGAIEASADAMSIVRQLTDAYQRISYV